MKYRKKPVVIDAIQFDGETWPEEFFGRPIKDASLHVQDRAIYIHTLEGIHKAVKGDWIIRGVKGEFYPCKPDIFEMTYEQEPEAEPREE